MVAIPEAPLYSRLTSLPKVEDDSEFEESVIWDIKNNIPVKIEDVDTAFLEIGKTKDNENNVDVYIVAAPKSVTSKYQDLGEVSKLELLALETESLANTRAVTELYKERESQIIIVDFGAKTTEVVIARNGVGS